MKITLWAFVDLRDDIALPRVFADKAEAERWGEDAGADVFECVVDVPLSALRFEDLTEQQINATIDALAKLRPR